MRIRRSTGFTLLLLTVLFVFPSTASALDYWTLAIAKNSSNEFMDVSGTSAKVWVYPVSNTGLGTNGIKVNSIYCQRRLNSSHVEVGIQWDYLHSNARTFWAHQDEDGYYSGGPNGIIGSAAASQWLPLKLVRRSGGSYWDYYINGDIVHTEAATNLIDGMHSEVSSERKTGTAGWASYRLLQMKPNYNMLWTAWYRAGEYWPDGVDTDSAWKPNTVHIQDTPENWVYIEPQ